MRRDENEIAVYLPFPPRNQYILVEKSTVAGRQLKIERVEMEMVPIFNFSNPFSKMCSCDILSYQQKDTRPTK